MSETLLFGFGLVLFVATTTATLLFGYFRFNALYREDARRAERIEVATASDGTEIMRTPVPAPGSLALDVR